MTITTVHEYIKKLTVDSQNDIVWSLVLVISLQQFSNKSYYWGEIDFKYSLQNEREGRLRVVPHFSSGIVERAKCERA